MSVYTKLRNSTIECLIDKLNKFISETDILSILAQDSVRIKKLMEIMPTAPVL